MTERDVEKSGDVGLTVLPEGSRWGKAHHVLLVFLVVAVLVWIGSGFYQVNADEVAVVERLGQFVSAAGPGGGGGGNATRVEQGLHYRLPWPIDRVFKIPVQQTRTLTVNTFYAPQDAYADFKRDAMLEDKTGQMTPEILNALYDPYLITADKNVVHVSLMVTYRINDPEAWIMTVSHESEEKASSDTVVAATVGEADMREELFQQIVQHALVRQLAVLPIDRVLFSDSEPGGDRWRLVLNNAVQNAMLLPDPSDPSGKKRIDLGVEVQKADVVATHWPSYQRVDEAFQSVLNAKSGADVVKFQANAYAQSAITQANSQKETMVREAEAYAKQITDQATGEASRFTQVYTQFQNAPDVTRWNVYADAAHTVSAAATRIYFVEPGQKTIITLDPPQFDASQVQTGQGGQNGPAR
jgi:membrane protease subunit HflK